MKTRAARGPAPSPLGPVAGAVIGFVVFILLGNRFSLLPRLAIALLVVAFWVYLSLLFARRRG